VPCSAIQQQAPADGRSRAPTVPPTLSASSLGVVVSSVDARAGQAGLCTYTGLWSARSGQAHGTMVRRRLHRTVSKARPGSPRVYFHYATSTARCSCFLPRDCGDHCVVSKRRPPNTEHYSVSRVFRATTRQVRRTCVPGTGQQYVIQLQAYVRTDPLPCLLY
jgi:hypothetical protein